MSTPQSLFAILANLSPLPREHWGVVTFPRVKVANFGQECTFIAESGIRFRAVRGKSSGMKTAYRIRPTMDGFGLISGELINEAHASAETFRAHRWVADDVQELLPSFGVRVAGKDSWSMGFDSLNLIDQSPAHQRWHLFTQIKPHGIRISWWADILHNDPVMRVYGKKIWSHRADPAYTKQFDYFAISSGELIFFDFWRRHGIWFPAQTGKRWLHVLNSGQLSLKDGSGLPLSGAMLAHASVDAAEAIMDPSDLSDPLVRSMRDLEAGAHGPIVGVCHNWDGDFMANRNRPRLGDPIIQWFEPKDVELERFLAEQEQYAGWFAGRPVALGKTPSQTGGQEDFGATKGTYAVTGLDPRFLRVMQYSVQAELFRGFNHYEDNGQPIRLEDHPSWVTWGGGTHWHTGVSPDRLGKDPTIAPGAGTGWNGMDDDHTSQNNLAAYLMLSDDPLMEDQVRHWVTTQAASYRMRFPQNGGGAARGQGRVVGALAQLMACMEGPITAEMFRIIAQRMQIAFQSPSLRVPGPMKVLAWGAPDPRRPVFKADGSLGPNVSMWEHGLAMVGMYCALKGMLVGEPPQEWREVLRIMGETLFSFGCFQQDGTWYTVNEILWSDGLPPPGGMVHPSPHILAVEGAAGTRDWTFAGILVAREFLGAGHPFASEMDQYIAAVTHGQEAEDRNRAEWWAAVKSIRF